jgi:hypothetical protein
MLAIYAVGMGVGCRRNDSQKNLGADSTPATNRTRPSGDRMLELDGRSASMRVPDSASLHSLTNGLTLELWFKAASFYKQSGAVNSLLRKNTEAGGENFFVRFRIVMGKPAIEMSSGGQILHAQFGFEPGTWYHLAGTCDPNAMTAFVNGVPVSSQPFTGSIQIDDSDLMIGKGDPNYSQGEYFHGDIADMRIWNVARSPEQIRTAMNARLTGQEPGLVAYWTFEDGTAKDFSPNGNNGSLDGEAKIVGVTSGEAPPSSSQNR